MVEEEREGPDGNELGVKSVLSRLFLFKNLGCLRVVEASAASKPSSSSNMLQQSQKCDEMREKTKIRVDSYSANCYIS